MAGKRKNRKNPRNAPLERFVWREGDVVVTNDPRKNRKDSKQDSSQPQDEKPRKKTSE